MTLDKLIDQLQKVRLKHGGNIQVVVEIQNPFTQRQTLSTVEDAIYTNKWKTGEVELKEAIWLDWRK